MTRRFVATRALFRDWQSGDEETWARTFLYLARYDGDWTEGLIEDIRENGIRTPIALGGDGRVWNGHHRLYAAARLGIQMIPFVLVDDLHSVPLSDFNEILGL